jgi:hypothetical protein
MKTRCDDQIQELLYQALETELAGVAIYETAIRCAFQDALRREWQMHLHEVRTHVLVLLDVFDELGLDPYRSTPIRATCAYIGGSLVEAMRTAQMTEDTPAAELVATACVTLAETHDCMNWRLIAHVAQHAEGDVKRVLTAAYGKVALPENRARGATAIQTPVGALGARHSRDQVH